MHGDVMVYAPLLCNGRKNNLSIVYSAVDFFKLGCILKDCLFKSFMTGVLHNRSALNKKEVRLRPRPDKEVILKNLKI